LDALRQDPYQILNAVKPADFRQQDEELLRTIGKDNAATMVHTPVYSLRTLRKSYPGPVFSPYAGTSCVVIRDNSVLLSDRGSPATILVPCTLFTSQRETMSRFLGFLQDSPCHAVEVPAGFPAPAGYRFSEVRPLFGILPDDELALAAYAVTITDFDRSTRYCGRCGAEASRHPSERAAVCTRCNRVTYPRLSPAIIVLVKKEEEVLLASSPRFPPDLHSVLAGFVEAGENCEECVHREVREEVGIEVANIRYFGSEPWPFPDSLMLGFVADYAGGEIRIDPAEIRSAGWFSRGNLPTLPSPASISRALIDAWVRGEI